MGLPNKYELQHLPEFCQEVSRIAGIPLALNKPVAGLRNYTRESGIGVNLVREAPLAMFATAPQLYGREGDIALGKKSGKASIEYFLQKYDLQADADQITEILAQVKALGQEKKRLLTEDEFFTIYQKVTDKMGIPPVKGKK